MITLYDHPRSGNCHKVRLLLSMLGLAYEAVFVDVLARVNHQPWFDRINPIQQIPVSDRRRLYHPGQSSDPGLSGQASTAANGFRTIRGRPARSSNGSSFAAKEVANGLQASRLFYIADEGIDIEAAQNEGRRVLAILDRRLTNRQWLCLDRPTIADVACFPYVGLAREGRLPLDEHRNVTAWIDCIAGLNGYVTMDGLPGPRRD